MVSGINIVKSVCYGEGKKKKAGYKVGQPNVKPSKFDGLRNFLFKIV
jgi:hypothetical protein